MIFIPSCMCLHILLFHGYHQNAWSLKYENFIVDLKISIYNYIINRVLNRKKTINLLYIVDIEFNI